VPAEPTRDPRRHLLALLLLLLCGVLLWTSERGRSLTADEPLHLIRGHALWWTHSSHLSYAHPPLANAITSLPQAARGDEAWGLGTTPDGQPRTNKTKRGPGPEVTHAEALTKLPGWTVAQPLDVSTAYFTHDFRTAKAELVSARRMMMLWTLGLGLFIYVFCERRWGFATAISALTLYSLHPTLLAHGQLATTDMPLAVTVFVSLAALIAWIERPSWIAVLGFAVATTAMVLSKHSGVAYVVVMSLMLLAAAGLGRGGFATQPGGRARRVALASAQLALVAVAMILAIDAIYLFDRVGLSIAEILAEPEPHNWISKKHEYQMLEQGPLAKLPPRLRLPVPYTWLFGLATVSEQNSMGHGNYFFGVRGDSGHPLYFPVMLFGKTPTGLLLLLGIGMWPAIARLRARHSPSVATSVLLVFSVLAFASACASDINIGVRHVLPLMPIMVVFAGRVAGNLIDSANPGPGATSAFEFPRALHGRRRPGLVGACMLGCALGAGWTFPTWLGDFNLLVGGPTGGHRISVIGEDWGQDLGDLADLAQTQGWTGLAYHTTFPLRREELEARGLEVHKLGCKQPYAGPDPVVIHLSDWVRRPNCFTWLGERRPAHVVNHHMLVFE
jgi:4-amino-4-deoxy-L-arabinose transferase-like glycosyltransferase